MGGAPKHPTWYLNLLADPHVTPQDGPDLTDFTARVAHDDERAAWWALASEGWTSYDDYQAKTDRVIPVVVLDPTGCTGCLSAIIVDRKSVGSGRSVTVR